MPLHIATVATEPQPLERTATVIGPGLVQLEVETQVPYASSKVLHWRLSDGKKPPLDIALNADTGAFLRLVFFVSHELVPPGRRAARAPAPPVVRAACSSTLRRGPMASTGTGMWTSRAPRTCDWWKMN